MTTKDTTVPNVQPVTVMPQEGRSSGTPSQPVGETSASQREQAVTGGTGSTAACCGAAVQQSCCAPAAKADCCGAPTTPGNCGCK